MDPRLRQAINDVFERGGATTLGGGGVIAFAAGQARKRQLLGRAHAGDASTGTPISALHGIARGKAGLAGVAGGSKATGGGGIDGGARTLRAAAIKTELAVFGISGAVLVGRIALRYRQLVVADRRAAAARGDAVGDELDAEGGSDFTDD